MTVEELAPGQQIRTAGDAEIWLAPLVKGRGAVYVLRFTGRRTGQAFEISLSRTELVRILTAAERITDADDETVSAWLDSAAAEAIRHSARRPAPLNATQRQRKPART